MPDPTDRFGLDTFAQGEDNWDHTDTVELFDELGIERGLLADRPASGTYDDELYLATDENVLYQWDAGNTTWDTVAGGGTDTRIDVSDDGTLVVSEPTDLNAGTNLTATDDGDGTVTLDASGGSGGTDTRINVSDDGTPILSEPTDVNIGSDITAINNGDGTVTLNADVPSGVSESYFSDLEGRRPYQINSEPNGIYVPSRDETYVVYHASPDAYIRVYDHAAGEWGPETLVASGDLEDGHGAPTFTIDDSGFIHVIFNGWAAMGDAIYAVSDNAYDVSSWTARSDTPFSTDDVSYPGPFFNNGTLYALFRLGSGSNRPIGYYQSTDGGSTWSSSTTLIDFGDNLYPSSFVQEGNIIHLFFKYRNSDDDGDIHYYVKWDVTNDTLTAPDGTSLSVPLGQTEADNNAQIVDLDDLPDYTGTSTSPKAGLDENGDAYVTLSKQLASDSTFDTFVYIYDSSTDTWTNELITNIPAFQAAAGIVVKGPDNVDLYVGEDSPDGNFTRITRYDYDGSWTGPTNILNTADSGPYTMPTAVHDFDPELEVLLGERYTDSTPLPPTKAWGYGANGFVRVDLSASPQIVKSGSVTLTSGSAVVDTNVSTSTDATFNIYLGPTTADADVAADLRADSGTGTYVFDIEETDTSVGNPTVSFDVTRVR